MDIVFVYKCFYLGMNVFSRYELASFMELSKAPKTPSPSPSTTHQMFEECILSALKVET